MGRRLLIDYSKNTAPLQNDGADGDKVVGMSLRFHEPETLAWLGRNEREPASMKRGPKKRTFPSAIFPVQQSSLMDVSATSRSQSLSNLDTGTSTSTSDLNDGRSSSPLMRRTNTSPPRLRKKGSSRSLSPKQATRRDNIFNNQVTFQLRKSNNNNGNGNSGSSRARYNDKLHYSDSDLNFLDTRSVHTTNTSAMGSSSATSNHTRRSVFDEASIHSAPAKPTNPNSSYRSLMNNGGMDTSSSSSRMMDASTSSSTVRSSIRSSVRDSIKEEPELEFVAEFGESDEEEEEQQPKLKQTAENNDERDDDDEQEERSFLPSALSTSQQEQHNRHRSSGSSSKSPTRNGKKGKKKKQQPTLDEWFGKGGKKGGGGSTKRSGKSKSPKRSKTSSKSPTRVKPVDLLDDDDAMSQMSQSYPMGPRARRMLPKRTMSFDDSSRKFEGGGGDRSVVSHARRGRRRHNRKNDNDDEEEADMDDGRTVLTAATGNTRRGGRRPNRTKTTDGSVSTGAGTAGGRRSPRRGGVGRTRSFDGSTASSFMSMKGDSSYSFLSGSRIRVRQGRGGSARDLLSETRRQTAKDDASVSSQFSRSRTAPVRRPVLTRAQSCDSVAERMN